MTGKSAAAAIVLALAFLATGCGSVAPPATTPAAGRTASPAARTSHCPDYPASVYGIDANQLKDTGGGAQLLTVIARSAARTTATFTAWARTAGNCWRPASFAGQPAQPFRAQTGRGGLLPISRRVPGDWATPTGLFRFGKTIYGNSAVSPSGRYRYHHLVCGDWWDEQPGSPAYDHFRHVTCGITPPYGDDSEALWTETIPYQHFIDIKMPHPPDNGAGIFLHDDMPVGYTEGCVALPNAELDAVLGWLNPADRPHILIAVSSAAY
jgi:L,D-peptidoglycan transpeptidase YkuD (ErfK/YbiS/YcfS/YnhG family)